MFRVFQKTGMASQWLSRVRWVAEFITSIGDKKTDSGEERLHHRFLITMALLMSAGGVVWGSICALYGLILPALIPYGYTVCTGLNLLFFYLTKDFRVVRVVQVTMSLLLPFIFQWSLGGFVPSGAVILWAMLALVGAFTFQDSRSNIKWLFAYLALTLLSGVIDRAVSTNALDLPPALITLFFVVNIGCNSAIVFGLLLHFVQSHEQANRLLAMERQRAEDLLLNILPAPVAEQLKRQNRNVAAGYESVTVLFADICDFTTFSAHITPGEVVGFLNQIFSEFDRLAEKHGLEKIKTIGDAYMVVGGLPEPRPNHAEAIIEMALDMQQCIARYQRDGGEPMKMRVGVNSGSVVAGVIGLKKFIYDLWGDAVNTASRMESQGVAGEIQVTETTYQLLKDKYHFQSRGEIYVKGKSAMPVYLLQGRNGFC